MWQDIIVFIAVSMAAAYLLRRFLPGREPKKPVPTPCGACKACSGGGCH